MNAVRIRNIIIVGCDITVLQRDPSRVPAEALAADEPLRDLALAGGKQVGGQEVNEVRDILSSSRWVHDLA